MMNIFKEQPVAWTLCRREHSTKGALLFWRPSNKQIRLELEYLQ